jgi:hypothetical protein
MLRKVEVLNLIKLLLKITKLITFIISNLLDLDILLDLYKLDILNYKLIIY